MSVKATDSTKTRLFSSEMELIAYKLALAIRRAADRSSSRAFDILAQELEKEFGL